VKRCADILGCSYKKNHDDNYNWFILAGKEKLSKIYARFLGMKSFEKHINYSEVCRFDRDSKLSLLAGMLDSDGCLCLGDGGIVLSFGCQSKPTVETFSMLLRELFNADTTIRLDDRPKYKNGGVFEVKLKSSATIKIIMKALEGKLCRVHMQDAWWSLPEQRRIDRAGFTKTGVGRAKTYDISVDNETNLYLLGNGCVTHNSGKSTLIAADMLHTALHNPNTDQLYVGLTKGHAKKTISKAFLDMIKEYDLPCKMNSNTLEIKFKNGSTIYLEGAKDQAAIERFRGMKLFKAVLDEAQSFPPSLAMTLVSEIIQPALGDLCGSFVIAGTPDPLCQSVLFRAFKHEKPFNNFKAFTWNVTDNTKFPAFVNGKKTPETYLADVRERTGYKETDAGYRREYLGEFVEDLGSLAYGFNPKRDVCPVSRFDKHKEWKYIISGDVGFCDADALVVMAFSYEDSVAYVVESYSKSGQDLTSFMTKVKELRDKYLPIRTVIDPGGGGVKVVAELRARYSIQADVAEKYSPKVIGCGLVADEFRRERIKILDTDENELLITQLSTIAFKERYNRNGDKVRYVPDGDQVIGEKGKIGDDVADAFLYGFKLLRNYVGHEVDKLSPEEERARMVQEHKSLLIKKAMEDAQEKDRRFDRWF
jgi:hypothetical protein